ncbi:MAG: leucine--tRNA ligase [Nanoarchaeota archaeon]
MEVPNQKKIEDKWQKFWQENKIFEPKVDEKKKPYFITAAYPYANSILHIGHGRMFSMADVVARYHRLKGENVLYPMAFHISGTPVLAVADGISRGDKKQIKMTKDAISEYITDKKEQEKLIKKFKDPFEIAEFFSSTIEETFNEVGLSIDWTRQFTTGDEIYKKFIEWQFEKLHKQGILVQGTYPILYSVADKNAVGEDDIKDGDTEKVTLSEMDYLLFRLEGQEIYFPCATLRPDALFGTTNLWLNSKIKHVKIQVAGKTWIVSEDAAIKVEHQFPNTKNLGKIDVKEFIGKNVIAPLIDRVIPIAEASFIDSDHGTGIVYSSPAGSPDDFLSLKQAQKDGRLPKEIKVINTVTTKDKKGNIINTGGECPAELKLKKYGVKSAEDKEKIEQAKQELYKEEHFGGMLTGDVGEFEGVYIKKAKELVSQKLKEKGLGGTFYETSRKAITRGGDKVIVANLEGQWFLDYTKEETKKKAHEVMENMVYLPKKLEATQKGYIDWVAMRPCARRRGIGTPLPFDKEWVIESLSDSTIYQMFYLISNTLTKNKISAEKLSIEFFDYVLLGKGNSTMIAEESEIDLKLIEEMRSQVEYFKNINCRYTAGTHMSNHLSFLIYHYGLIFPKENWPTNITVGGLMIREGSKISKSKGNGTPLIRVKKEWGVDLFRLYLVLTSSFDVELDFKDEEVSQLEKKFNRLKELLFKAKSCEKKFYGEFEERDKWLISRFYSRAKEYFSLMDEMKIREAHISLIYDFISEMNYHMRLTNEGRTLEVLRFIFEDYVKLLAPVTPHTCEELYEGEGKEKENCVSLASFSMLGKDEYINKEIEDVEAIISNLIEEISRQKETRNISKLKSIKIIQATDSKFELFDKMADLLDQTRDFKTIMQELMKNFASEQKFIQKFLPKCLGDGISKYLPKEEEKNLIENVNKVIKEEFGVKAKIISEEKESKGLPAKPQIVVE